jgi:hypothetical protein
MSATPQRTNIARFGMGCRMYAVVCDAENVLANIARFEDEIKQSHALQKRLAYARAWYAYQDEKGAWHFGPSKFVGYDGMTAQRYIETAEDRDGRRTEAQLQQWFTQVDPASQLGKELSAALFALLAQYGKAPSTKMRINVPNAVYEAQLGQSAKDPHDVILDMIVIAAKTLPPSQFEKLRAFLGSRKS